MKLKHLDFDFEAKQILPDADDGFFRFEGLASTFGNIDLVDDIVMKGAFEDSIKEITPKILWKHFSFEPIGMPEILQETDEGLFIRAKLPKEDSLVSGRIIPQMKVGSINSMSIGFRVPEGGQEIRPDGIRILNKLILKEISLVSFPANEMALVSGFKQEFFDVDKVKTFTSRQLENALRESGVFSKQAATFISSKLDLGEPKPTYDDELAELLTKADKHLNTNSVNALDELLKKVNTYVS